MEAKAFAALDRLLDQALELPAAERLAWVDRLAPEHEALKPRLRALLSRSDQERLRTLPPLGARADEGRWTLRSGDEVGPYRLLRELGAGGMGAVWLAERSDGILNRPVALKLPRGDWQASGLAERMARERDILATLNHPHIARLYDAGISDGGQPYLALEYVEGRAVDVYCREAKLGVAARLALLLQVAHAVLHAHERLVVHRDLKPANILVTDEGQVRLLDFGIAALIAEGQTQATHLTQAAGCAMTPDYASPEQIMGTPLTVASDVYSLGVVMYELLTGARPYKLERHSLGALEQAILQAEPQRPSESVRDPTLRRALRGDLDTIVQKALKKRPEERYPTVHALAEDLERHRSGRAVRARADSALYRLGRLVRRHRLVVGSAAAVLLAIVGGAAVAVGQAQVARAEARRACAVKELVLSILRDADPFVGTGKAVDLLRQAKARVDGMHDAGPEVRVELLNALGWSLLAYQDSASAEAVVQEAVAEARRSLPPLHRQHLRARVLLAIAQRYRGRNREMRAELDELLPLLRKTAADDPQDLIRALRNSANLALHEGAYATAIAEAQEAAQRAESYFGERHAETATSALVLALARLDGNDARAALDAARRAYRLSLEARNGNRRHPSVIEAQAVLGRALRADGQLRPAVEQLTQALHETVEVYGPDGMSVGFYSESLAEAALDLGRTGEALERSARAVEIVSAHAGPGSYVLGVAQRLRGETLLEADQPRLALAFLEPAQRAFSAALGSAHPRTAAVQISQGLARARLGQLDDARASLLPLARAQVDGAARALGIVERLRGNAAEALRLQAASLAALAEGPRADYERIEDPARARAGRAGARSAGGRGRVADCGTDTVPSLARAAYARGPGARRGPRARPSRRGVGRSLRAVAVPHVR